MSPMPGIFCSVEFIELLIRPAIGERLAVQQIDLGFGAARAQRRDPEAVQQDAVGEVERADLGTNLQVHAVAVNHRREVQPDAELLVRDRDRQVRAGALRDRHGKLAAGEEAGFLAALGDEVRLGQALELPLVESALITAPS